MIYTSVVLRNIYSGWKQICRVEEINISGSVLGSVVHIQRARSITIDTVGVLSASALGGAY